MNVSVNALLAVAPLANTEQLGPEHDAQVPLV
jgi:hypothetical protein